MFGLSKRHIFLLALLLVALGVYYFPRYYASHNKTGKTIDIEALTTEAHAGSADAQARLGSYYFTGLPLHHKNFEKDYQKSIYWLRQAADQGHVGALGKLGFMYMNGEGVEKNIDRGLYWYERAAKKGNAEVATHLGSLYYTGTFTEINYDKAFSLFLLGAENGNMDATYYLGVSYKYGNGIDRNHEKAFGYLTKAVQKNIGQETYSYANYELGSMYEKGHGVEKDYNKAYEHFEIAASEGNVPALYALGYAYYMGHGTSKNNFRAGEYFQKAWEKGYVHASKVLEKTRIRCNWELKNPNASNSDHCEILKGVNYQKSKSANK